MNNWLVRNTCGLVFPVSVLQMSSILSPRRPRHKSPSGYSSGLPPTCRSFHERILMTLKSNNPRIRMPIAD